MLYEVGATVHCVEQVKEQAAQEQDQLHRPLVLVNAEKVHAVLQNTQSVKNLSNILLYKTCRIFKTKHGH